jgi:hypothetical protein
VGLGRGYRLEKTRPPSERSLKRIKKAMESFGLTVRIGG